MTGSSIDFIVIPIVATICLAAWLIMVYYADSHPRWREPPAGPGAAATERSAHR
jgi:hypothetical protein